MIHKNNDLSSYHELIDKINKINLENKSDREIFEISTEMINKIKHETVTNELLVKAFALVKEAIWRVLGLKAYDEQLLAGFAMYDGKLIEMQTGEGKTLTAVFTAYLNSIAGSKVNIYTFNDYLAKRDAALMGPVLKFLGLSAGYVNEYMDKDERKAAYSCDITYVTAKEAGFDYLRDFLCSEKLNLLEPPLDCVIVDEADSIMIDEAKIPLVIASSGINKNSKDLQCIRETINILQPEIHYEIEEKKNSVYFTNEGINIIEASLKCTNIYSQGNEELLSQLTNAIQAEVMYQRDIDYIVRNNKMELIDEYTGRIAEDRHLPDGLQAAIETKEGLDNLSKGVIMSQITMQGFIKLHKKVCGMTGTAYDSRKEFERFYDLEVVIIPPHKPCIRKDYPDLIFSHKEAKYNAIIEEIVKVHKTGQPILIGTCSVKESIYISSRLKKREVNCQVLNAKNDEVEAAIIALAGSLFAVTVSTNMAGRGTDIKLGGQQGIDYEKVLNLGGLYIIGTSIYESPRIDKQLKGRAGRQGDSGMSRFFISLEDDLIKKYGIENVIGSKQYIEIQNEPIVDIRIERGLEHLRKVINGRNLDLRNWQSRYSYIIEKQKIIVYAKKIDLLKNGMQKSILKEKSPELYLKINNIIDKITFEKLEMQTTLYYINKCWSEYLAYILDIRDLCYLEVLGGKDPFDKFQMNAVNAFEDFQKNVESDVISEFENLKLDLNGIDNLRERMSVSPSTWTYLLKENSFDESLGLKLFSKSNSGIAPFAMIFMWPSIFITFILEHFKKKKYLKR